MVRSVNVFEEFPEVENKTEEQGDDTIEKLISVALKGEHQEIELLKSLGEYEVCRILRRATMKVSKTFKKQAKKVLKQYFAEVTTGYSSIDTFKAYRTLAICAVYYEVEAERVDDRLSEYRTYLNAGHWLDAFFGRERVEEDLYDFRKK